jgi:hypothetical protein
MRVVAVTASDARLIHGALQERPVHIDLVLYLTVAVIQPLFEQRGTERIQRRATGGASFSDQLSARMTRGAP